MNRIVCSAYYLTKHEWNAGSYIGRYPMLENARNDLTYTDFSRIV